MSVEPQIDVVFDWGRRHCRAHWCLYRSVVYDVPVRLTQVRDERVAQAELERQMAQAGLDVAQADARVAQLEQAQAEAELEQATAREAQAQVARDEEVLERTGGQRRPRHCRWVTLTCGARNNVFVACFFKF